MKMKYIVCGAVMAAGIGLATPKAWGAPKTDSCNAQISYFVQKQARFHVFAKADEIRATVKATKNDQVTVTVDVKIINDIANAQKAVAYFKDTSVDVTKIVDIEDFFVAPGIPNCVTKINVRIPPD